MEDLFHQFQAWLESTNATLEQLTPAAAIGQPEREKQLEQAKVIITSHMMREYAICVIMLICFIYVNTHLMLALFMNRFICAYNFHV